MTRAELERTQLLALRTTLEHAVRHSPFYQKHLGSLAKVAKRFPGSLSDLATLPFLCREHIIEQGHLMLSVSQSRVARIITMQTSGSTGTPKRLAFSAQDLTSTMDFFLHGMYSLIDGTDLVHYKIMLAWITIIACGILKISSILKRRIFSATQSSMPLPLSLCL
jgi:phenylacetate-coenzyme A ligase PaaK-like adenylate-forming protein